MNRNQESRIWNNKIQDNPNWLRQGTQLQNAEHVSFRLVPILRSTSILGTDMIKNLKMTLDYDTGTWWLPGSPPTRYQMEARPQSLPRPIIESITSDKRKATKSSKKDSSGISENKRNRKTQTSVNNRINSEKNRIENNNKQLKPRFGRKIKLKSERENGKTIIGRNLNDFNQNKENPAPFQKSQNVQNPIINPYKEIPSLFSIPTYNRFQILENPTPQTQDNNEDQESEETMTTRIFYNGKVPEELRNDLNKKLESRKTQTSNGTSDIRNKNSWINFRNKAILLNNIGGKLTKQFEPKDNAAEVCEGIVELDESRSEIGRNCKMQNTRNRNTIKTDTPNTT